MAAFVEVVTVANGISALAPVVFAATAALGMLVLVFLYVARRRLIE